MKNSIMMKHLEVCFTEIKSKPRQGEKNVLGFPCTGVERSRLSGEGRERTERWGKASRTKQGTQALHEVIPQGLIENQSPEYLTKHQELEEKTFLTTQSAIGRRVGDSLRKI